MLPTACAPDRRRRPILAVAAAGLLVALAVAPAIAASKAPRQVPAVDAAAITRGQGIAKANCSPCHAVGRFGDSPLKIAPPFRTLHERYPVDELEESLAEGIVTGHPTMPQFQFAPDQIADFIAYLKSLER